MTIYQIVLVIILGLGPIDKITVGPFSSMDACAQAIYVLNQESPENHYVCEAQLRDFR